jgi:hypothetical protein
VVPIEDGKVVRVGYRLFAGPHDTVPRISAVTAELTDKKVKYSGCRKAVLVPGQTWAAPDFLVLPPAGRQNEKRVPTPTSPEKNRRCRGRFSAGWPN